MNAEREGGLHTPEGCHHGFGREELLEAREDEAAHHVTQALRREGRRELRRARLCRAPIAARGCVNRINPTCEAGL